MWILVLIGGGKQCEIGSRMKGEVYAVAYCR